MTTAFRRLLWPAAMTTVMLVVLLGLGTWQVKRLAWKQGILAQIEHAELAPPVPFVPSAKQDIPPPFTKVSVTGTYMADKTALYGAEVRDIASGPAMGAQLIEPLRVDGGGLLLVDRGWVPLSRQVPLDQPSGEVTVSGYVRSGDKHSWFSATDDLAGRRFFTLDPKTIGDALQEPDALPLVLVALAPPNVAADHWPDPARHLPRPPNNHLWYAITWYGLAVALLAIFIIWARKGVRA